MPKQKTSISGAKKRFKVTGTGKLLRRQAMQSHILEKKSPKRKRSVHVGTSRSRRATQERPSSSCWEGGRPMPRVKRSVHARKKRRKVLEEAKGYWGLKSHDLHPREGAGRALARLRLPRPQEQEADDPAPLDHPHQRRRARSTGSRTTSSSPAARRREIELDRKVLADLAVSDPAAFGAIAEQAKGCAAQSLTR